MSGHSKWATIKRQKSITDAKRGAVFTKMAHLITIAAREKGGNPEVNFTLRLAIDRAKAANVPKGNIERAIKRGTGELAGEAIEELVYEGFGPFNSQFIVKCLTDNKNRTAAEIRHIFSKHGGSLSPVAWNFEQKGVIRIAQENLGKKLNEDLELELIDAGADEILKEDYGVSIFCLINNLQQIKSVLDSKKIEIESAQMEYITKEKRKLTKSQKEKINKFTEALEDNEDVGDYYTNLDM